MNRAYIAVLAGASLLWSVGCSSKKYVRNQTAPLVEKTNELDDMTAKNNRAIRDVDQRAQQGIGQAQAAANAADQKAVQAGQSADQANQAAQQAVNRVDTLAGAVSNLDTYRPVATTEVHFGFNKADLTKKSKETLDQLGQEIQGQKSYILELTGGTDSVGGADYNYKLSERRADAVVQYLVSKFNVPAHRIYIVGLGKDKEVASNRTASGRAQNRRVDIRLLTNAPNGPQGSTAAQNAGGTQGTASTAPTSPQ